MNNSPIRVLYYIAYYQRMAGANRGLFNLITRLPQTVQPFVITAGEGRVTEAYRNAGIEVEVLPPGPSLNQFGKAMLTWSPMKQAWVAISELLPYTLQMQQVIQAIQPDLIHINDSRGTLLFGAAAKLSGRPIIGHMRGEPPFGGITQTLFETVCDRIITVCDSIQPFLGPKAQKKAITVYNGVAKRLGQEPAIPWLITLKEQEMLIVSCFASVVPFKGHHHLLHAIAELNRRGWGDRAVFICVGDLVPEYEAYQRWLTQQQQELGIENVIFTGWQANPFSFYQATDIEVLPSVSQEQLHCGDQTIDVHGNEGLPNVHLEAMSFGLPVVGTAIAGVREQIEDGLNGLIVPPSDPMALADALETLLANPDLRQQMGQAGAERVSQHFSMEAYVANVMRVYQSLVPTLVPELVEPESHQNQVLPA